ncbi:MAG: hypothetical protein IJC57_03520, partial [Clostridia bacterium]|nr:hypothetical protein [Clostridia bacterium]
PKIIKKANVKISSVTKIHKNTYVLKLEKKKGEIIIRPSGTEPKVKLYFFLQSFLIAIPHLANSSRSFFSSPSEVSSGISRFQSLTV